MPSRASRSGQGGAWPHIWTDNVKERNNQDQGVYAGEDKEDAADEPAGGITDTEDKGGTGESAPSEEQGESEQEIALSEEQQASAAAQGEG